MTSQAEIAALADLVLSSLEAAQRGSCAERMYHYALGNIADARAALRRGDEEMAAIHFNFAVVAHRPGTKATLYTAAE